MSTFPLTLNAVNQLQPLGPQVGCVSTWRASGGDPQFAVLWQGETLAAGWYVFRGTINVLRGRMHAPLLYPTYGQGIIESNRLELPFDAPRGESRTFEVVVRFSTPLTGLRFDPSVAPMDFELSELSLRQINRPEAMHRLMSGLFGRADTTAERLRIATRTALNLLRYGVRGMAERLFLNYSQRLLAGSFSDYEVWQEFYDNRDEEWREHAHTMLANLQSAPLVSILVPTYNTPDAWLRRCIESAIEQVYPHWELCVADDASPEPHVVSILEEYSQKDARIRYSVRETNGHISQATNSALQMARGTYVALLDHDDELHPMALLECVRAFEANPEWKMLFTDEDKIDINGIRSDPYFKSDWNPDLFLSQNCVCHLTVCQTEMMRRVGGFRIGYEGAQDWDLVLRLSEVLTSAQIGHVPRVLYHWRMIQGSTAMAPGEKSYAHLAALRSVQSHLDRVHGGAEVQEMPTYSGYFRITYPLPLPEPLVTLLIPTRDRVDLLVQCVDSILEKTRYKNYEILIIDNNSQEAATQEYFSHIQQDPRVRVLPYPYAFNYSAINNAGAKEARGTILGLLNNDVEVISPDWLTEMVSHALRAEIGVVGAMLYYPDDTIQHAGVILGIGGVAGHCYVGMPRGWPGDKHRGGLAQSLSAVTAACAVVRKSVFDQVGGLDERLEVAFNDVDFCLRVREAGYRNLWTPFAELYHHESASRGYETTPEKIARFKREESFMKERWGESLVNDPYYNLNLTLDSTPFTLSYPPRIN